MAPSPASELRTARSERILPGLWRLRLPLPWSAIPHCNAWLLDAADGEGHVLVDCGLDSEGSLAQLEAVMAGIGKPLSETRLLVCTHGHIDHYGQAASIVAATGCELWMHPRHEHASMAIEDPDGLMSQRIAVAREAGVPAPLAEQYREHAPPPGEGLSGYAAPDRDLVPGVRVPSALGDWEVLETPGHAPSHVVLLQAERRLLIGGDHVLGRVSLYYDYGWTDDPVAEYLTSLDVVEGLDARLCLPGHGKSFTDVAGHARAHREAALARIAKVEDVVRAREPATAVEMIADIFDRAMDAQNAGWLISEAMGYLRHLERAGRISRADEDGVVRWRTVRSA